MSKFITLSECFLSLLYGWMDGKTDRDGFNVRKWDDDVNDPVPIDFILIECVNKGKEREFGGKHSRGECYYQ